MEKREKEASSEIKPFKKRIEQVVEGVYVAIGYALANSILLQTSEGNIIVDATESIEAAREIKAEFKRYSDRPTRALIYIHSHLDHIRGASVFIEEGTDVYAHYKFPTVLYEDKFNPLQTIMTVRNRRQFGTDLPGDKKSPVNLRWRDEETAPYILPNKLFQNDWETLTIGGQTLEVFHSPTDSEDHIFIWLPDKQVLLCGDAFYMAFPNLFAIRGSIRQIKKWVASLDKIRDLMPAFLIPSHSNPLGGKEHIQEELTNYRDAIQYIHDAVIRGINDGKTPDELVKEIRLPSHLAGQPCLREIYGQISWTVRGIFNVYLGFFDGNATSLNPLFPHDRAKRIIDLVGDRQKLINAAQQAILHEDCQWAAELTDILLAVDSKDREACTLKAEVLIKMSQKTINMNARNYYLSQANELQGNIEIQTGNSNRNELLTGLSMDAVFEILPSRLSPEAMADREISAGIEIIDIQKKYRLVIRRGVTEIRSGFPENPDLSIQVLSMIWKEIVLGVREIHPSLLDGQIKIEGNPIKTSEFIFLFSP